MNRRFHFLFVRFAFISSLLLVGASTLSNEVAAEDLIQRMKSTTLERLGRELVQSGALDDFESTDHLNWYVVKSDGAAALLSNEGKQISLRFFVQKKLPLSKINSWNARKNARAYIDEDGDTFLADNLIIEGGVDKDCVKRWILSYVSELTEFIEYVE
ncbi:MAG: hypothetical protein Q4D38_10790 [Planctomycetia bacterium]|nr:hypothetical protein [Planctomycetia bacterium]